MADLTGIGSIFDFGSKVLDKLFPNKEEADKNKLALLQLAQSGELTELSGQLADVNSARVLAGQDIAGGNNFTKFLSSTFRPVAGYTCLAMTIYAAVSHTTVDPLIADLCKTVFEFFFGGRIIEKIMPHAAAAIASFGNK